MMKSNKIVFFNFLIFSTLISISASSWIGMWMGLEMNLLSIIPILFKFNNKFSSEAMMKYFSSQTLASMVLIFSILNILSNNFICSFSVLLNSALLLKMGAAPFHFWFPPVLEGISWNTSLIMLTWQKIAPFVMISYNLSTYPLLFFSIVSSSMIGSINGLNQISLRKIMAYSSINHISWMIASIMSSLSLWTLYFFVYSLISLSIITLMNTLNIFYTKQLVSKINNKPLKFFFILSFLSLGGLPPFLGFLPKWMTITVLMQHNLWLISLILIICSLITLFFYIRVSSSSILIFNQEILSVSNFSSFKLSIMNFLMIFGLSFSVNIFNLT